MKNIFIKKVLFVPIVLLITQTTVAQWQYYKAAYPEWPFIIEQVLSTGNNKCSIWKSSYQWTEGNQSGEVWTTPIEEAHQYQRYQFSEGKPTLVSTYLPSGNKLETMEYFYRNGLVSAIEVLTFDSLQEAKLNYAFHYSYYEKNDAPAQRTKIHGSPNDHVRVLDEFEFDKQYRLIRQKSTVVGTSLYMGNTLGLSANEKILTSVEYNDSIEIRKTLQNWHIVTDDRTTYLGANKEPILTEVRDIEGKKISTINYEYQNGLLTKKLYWINPTAPKVEQEEVKEKKHPKRKTKKRTNDTEEILEPLVFFEPTVYRVEYFFYDTNGLIERHIIEENSIQTIFEYSYFTE